MNLSEFLHELSLKRVELWVEESKLRYRAPAGALNADDVEQLKGYKQEIISRLNNRGLETAAPEPSTSYPLSYIQEGVWYTEQLQPGMATYNIPTAYRLRGRLNVAALEKSLAYIIQRHESLRTCFVTVDGEPRQMVEPTIDFQLRQIDLSQRSAELQEAELPALLSNEAHTPFNLEQPSLFRATLIGLASDHHILSLTLHHLVADGWSRKVLLDELSVCYAHFLRGKTAVPLAPLPIQYTDFAVWQRDRFEGDGLDEQLGFWRRQLGDDPPPLQLPTDYPRPTKPTYLGRSHTITLPSSLLTSLKELGQKESSSLFMTLLATFKTLLYRYAQHEDILVGTPIANRSSLETESLIGYLANTLVLRSDLSGNPTFRELLKRIKRMSLDTFAHQELPFEKLVKALNPTRDLTYTPYFQTMFVLQNFQQQAFVLEGISAEPYPIEGKTSKFDLTLTATEIDGALDVVFEYSTELFEPETIGRMAQHWQTLVSDAVANPDRSIGQLALLTSTEKSQLLPSLETPDHPLPKHDTLTAWFESRVVQAPNRLAVTCENQSLTYLELNQQANQLAHYLKQQGGKSGALIGVMLDRSADMIVAILGILKAGAAYLPIDPSMPPARIGFILQDAQVDIVLTQESMTGAVLNFEAKLIQIDQDREVISSCATSNLVEQTNRSDLAYVIYTSGSTGKPKGVLVNHSHVGRLFSATDDWFGFNENDVWSLFHSVAFDFSVWEIWGALLYGGRLVIVPHWVSRSPDDFCQLLLDEQITVLNQTPSAFRQLIQAEANSDRADALSLRYVIFGGEALEMGMLQPWFERHGDQNPQLVNMYGITETTVHVTYRPLSSADLDSGSLIGHPIPDLQLYILDAYRQPVPIGVPGEIYVGGAGVSGGYLNRPELTAERFLPNPFSISKPGATLYKTGDLARFRQNGDIEYFGRIDHQVQLRGFRIELGEIESALTGHPNVRQVTVIDREDVPGDKRLVAYIVLAGTDAPSAKRWRAYLQDKLPSYMIPSAFVMIDSFPLTLNGKLDRRSLPAPTVPVGESIDFVAPSTPTEEAVASIWQEVLNVEQVGAHDNFFDLGGHSLLATKIVSRISKMFSISLPLTSFFEAPTVAESAELIETLQFLLDSF